MGAGDGTREVGRSQTAWDLMEHVKGSSLDPKVKPLEDFKTKWYRTLLLFENLN